MLSPVSMASVSRVHFGDSSMLEREGAYSNKTQTTAAPVEAAEEKKSNTGKKVAIGAAVVAALLLTLGALSRKKIIFKPLDAEALKAAKWYSPAKWGHYLHEAGEKIAQWTWDPTRKLWNKIFKKGGTKPATPPTDGAAA